MAEVKFYLEKRKDKKTGKLITLKVPIFLFYSFNGQRLQYYTGLRIDAPMWNEQEMKVKKNFAEAAEYNRELTKLKAKVEEIHDKATVNGLIPDTDYFRDNLAGKSMSTPDRKTIWEAYRDYLKSLAVTKAPKTVTAALYNYKSLEDFSRSRRMKLTFEKIDMSFYEEYLDYCYNEKKYFNNYVGTQIRRLKAFLNWSLAKGYHNSREFEKEGFKKPYENTEIIYLYYEEVEKLMGLKFEKHEEHLREILRQVRDMYCLGCYTGMRHSDIVSLKPENIEPDKLILQTIKTRELNVVPLNPHSRKILNRNKNKHELFAMPQFDISQSNRYLKIIMKAAKLNRKVQIIHFRGAKRFEETQSLWQCASFHTSKKTFVTNFLERGGSLTTAMAIAGNRSYQSAKRYFKIADTLRSKEMAKAFGK